MAYRHNKINILVVPFLVLFCSIASSKESGDFKPTAVGDAPPEYRWVSHISSGPADTSTVDASPDGVRGMFYRLAFISNDDVFTRPIMRIDELIYGDAGCCWTIKRSWNVDFNELEKSGVHMPPPEMSAIHSVVWLGARKAKVRYGESWCTMSGIGSKSILAKCELTGKKTKSSGSETIIFYANDGVKQIHTDPKSPELQ